MKLGHFDLKLKKKKHLRPNYAATKLNKSISEHGNFIDAQVTLIKVEFDQIPLTRHLQFRLADFFYGAARLQVSSLHSRR